MQSSIKPINLIAKYLMASCSILIVGCYIPNLDSVADEDNEFSEKLDTAAVYKIDKLNLEFESTNILEFSYYEDESYTFEGDNMDVDLDIFSEEEQLEEFFEDLRLAVRENSEHGNTNETIDVGELPFIENSYCVKYKTEFMKEYIPVIEAGVWDKKNKATYEIVVWCWDGDEQAGLDAMLSFKHIATDTTLQVSK